MGYIGNKPTAVPLTSADIQDGVITAADLGANSVDSSELVNGSVDLGHLSASGTASSSTFLRGDNSWVAAGGDLSFGGDTFGADKTIGSNDTYALSFETDGNEAMKIDTAGIITKPLQSAFFAISGNNTVISTSGTSATSTIIIDTERFDQNADFDTGTYTFTAPVTGRYHFNLLGKAKDLTSGYGYLFLTLSNYEYNIMFAGQSNSYNNYNAGCLSMIVDMDASDTARMRIQTSSDNAWTSLANQYFSGNLVC